MSGVIETQVLRNELGSRATSTGAFAIKAGSSPIPRNASAIAYVADGVFGSLAATDFPLTGDACNIRVPSGYTALFVLAINGATGGVKAFQSNKFLSNTTKTVDMGGRDANGLKVTESRYDVFLASKTIAGATVLANAFGDIEFMSQALPDLPAGHFPVGVVKVVNATGADFVPGTTALDAASTTVTYTNVAVMPKARNF